MNNFNLSLIGGALFNILPWTRVLARVGPEATAYCFASACFLFSLYHLLNKGKTFSLIFCLISLAILYLSYPPGLLLAPLLAICLPILLTKHSSEYKGLSIKILLFGLIFLGLLFIDFHNDGGFKESISRAQNAQGLSGIASFDLKTLSATLYSRAKIYAGNYLGYLSPQFLFISGDSNLRHNSGFGGQLFVSLIFAFYFGLFFVIEKVKNLNMKILLAYLLIAALPASITLEGSLEAITRLPLHGLRSSCILPPIAVILILGLFEIYKRKRLLGILYLILIAVNSYLFYSDYFNVYPKRARAFDDPGLRVVSRKAVSIIQRNPEKKLFFSSPFITIQFHNLDKIGINSLVTGSGILSNVYHYESRGNTEPQKGDLILIHEPFPLEQIQKKYKFISRIKNPALPTGQFGASLLEVTE